MTINLGGVIIHDRYVIARAYLSNGFWLDFFAALPYALVVKAITGGSSGNLTAVRLLRLLRLVRVVVKLMRNSNNVTEAVTSGRFLFNPALARVVQLLCMLLLTCHWMGCMWWLVGTLDRSEYWTEGDRADEWGPAEWLKQVAEV